MNKPLIAVLSFRKNMDEIQQADPKAKRKAIWLVGITTLFGFCAMLAFEYYQDDFQSWLELNIGYLVQNAYVVFLVAVVFISPVIVAGIYLLFLGNRIVRSQRFPIPGHAVIRDTQVLRGLRAIRRGRIIQLLSLLLLVAAGAIPFLFLAIFRALG